MSIYVTKSLSLPLKSQLIVLSGSFWFLIPSQNHWAFRSNPNSEPTYFGIKKTEENTLVTKSLSLPLKSQHFMKTTKMLAIVSHKITEPSAQIPTDCGRWFYRPMAEASVTKSLSLPLKSQHRMLKYMVCQHPLTHVTKSLSLPLKSQPKNWKEQELLPTGHKITEPSAQIPTKLKQEIEEELDKSQNHWAFRSNPNKLKQRQMNKLMGHKITEPSAQIPTFFYYYRSTMVFHGIIIALSFARFAWECI